MRWPRLQVVGGANGSGKTTLARELVAETGIKYLGADDIAAALNPASPASVAIPAARLFSRRVAEAIAGGESLLIESTLAGLSLQKTLAQAQAAGFRVSIYFIYLDSVELCLRRIAARVAAGGHSVPEADARRRFARANRNFRHVYRAVADDWNLFFNAAGGFQQIAIGDKQGLTVFDEGRYQQWLVMATK